MAGQKFLARPYFSQRAMFDCVSLSVFSCFSVDVSDYFICRVSVEAPVTRKVGSIADYDPGSTPGLNPAYQPVGISTRQRQEWEESVPMSSSAPCKCLSSSVWRLHDNSQLMAIFQVNLVCQYQNVSILGFIEARLMERWW